MSRLLGQFQIPGSWVLWVNDYDVTILHEPLQGIGFASQAGYMAASGDIIVRCDADTIAPADWLER
ncbi:MAG: glycosyltransferase family 2 protein, partial [Oxalobacteraceae bacterium]